MLIFFFLNNLEIEIIFVINFSYAEERQVNFIVVEGNNRVSTEEIIQYSSVEIGKSYTQEDVSQIIKRLFSTNLFTDINVRIIDTTLTIIVSETPIIEEEEEQEMVYDDDDIELV